MALKGIDISGWNGWPFNAVTEKAYGQSDFIIVKATQGTSFVNGSCDKAVQRAIKDGKLWGFYHYAGGGDPVKEADYFYSKCKSYFKKGIPCLDWESNQNTAWGSTTWCRKFVDRIHELTGVWCMVYVQASAVSQCASCASDCALWLAGYPDMRHSWSVPKFIYGTGAWKTYTIWQFTSGGGIDRNTAKLDREGWLKIAGASGTIDKPTEKPTTEKPTKKSNETIAAEVMAGKWGNGTDRKKRLEAAGYDYAAIQAIVNKKMATKPAKTLKVGSQVKIKSGAHQYGTTRTFASFVYGKVYKVVEISGNRVVFADGKTVMGAVAKSDCIIQ